MKVNSYTYARLIELLIEGTRSKRELAEESGLRYSTVLDYVNALHKRKLIHIVMWEPDSRGRYVTAVYKFGSGTDARQARISGAERQRQYKARRKQYEFAEVTAGRGRFVPVQSGHLKFEAISSKNTMTPTMTSSATSPGAVASSCQIEEEINERAASPTC